MSYRTSYRTKRTFDPSLRTRAIAVDHARASTDRGSRWLGNPKSQLSTPSTEHYERLVAQAVVPRPPRRQKKPHAIWNAEELGRWPTVALAKIGMQKARTIGPYPAPGPRSDAGTATIATAVDHVRRTPDLTRVGHPITG